MERGLSPEIVISPLWLRRSTNGRGNPNHYHPRNVQNYKCARQHYELGQEIIPRNLFVLVLVEGQYQHIPISGAVRFVLRTPNGISVQCQVIAVESDEQCLDG